MIEKLIERLNGLHPMSEALKERIITITKISKHPKKTILLKDGDVNNYICMVISGLVRSYYINEGKDITSRFMDEGFIITSWISFYTRKPGNEFIETQEDTILACVHYKDIQKLYDEFPEFNIIGRKQVEYSFYMAELRTRMLRKHTAEEKYKFFLENHAALLQRVSLKHVATYLGINEETLSRIRTKYHKQDH
jgi:CRP/FNR family transcriptional regulator, anaerobic regulatory protein